MCSNPKPGMPPIITGKGTSAGLQVSGSAGKVPAGAGKLLGEGYGRTMEDVAQRLGMSVDTLQDGMTDTGL